MNPFMLVFVCSFVCLFRYLGVVLTDGCMVCVLYVVFLGCVRIECVVMVDFRCMIHVKGVYFDMLLFCIFKAY